MLKQLSINSFTLIAEETVPFHEGFTAITGETGAGKSVLLKAHILVHLYFHPYMKDQMLM